VSKRWFYEPKNLKSKCVHVVATDKWLGRDLCEYTIPNLKQYATKIGADFNLITTHKFPEFPGNYERNINIDADIIIHPDTEDPTLTVNPFISIGCPWYNDSSGCFKPTAYSIRSGFNKALIDGFVVSSWYTHDIWEPLDMSYEEMSSFCNEEKRRVSEFNLTVNYCKYGYHLDQPIKDINNIYTLGFTTENLNIDDAILRVKAKLKEWGS